MPSRTLAVALLAAVALAAPMLASPVMPELPVIEPSPSPDVIDPMPPMQSPIPSLVVEPMPSPDVEPMPTQVVEPIASPSPVMESMPTPVVEPMPSVAGGAMAPKPSSTDMDHMMPISSPDVTGDPIVVTPAPVFGEPELSPSAMPAVRDVFQDYM